jgi:RNA polymerase sigma-70 factor (ECF subfamily)
MDNIDYISNGPDIGSWKPDKRPSKWSVDPNDPVERQQFWNHLNECLEQLEPRVAICYYLREMQEIEYKEVCNILSLKPTNLRVMLHRARKLLRRCLETNWVDK